MLQAILFDMDGLMINSEPMQSKAYEQLLKEYGKIPEFYETGVIQKVGVREKDNWEMMKEKYQIEEPVEILMEKRSSIYLDLIKENTMPMPGLYQLLDLLHEKEIKTAVASSSVIVHIETILDSLGVKDKFKEIVSGQFVQKGKPFPDIFLEAAKKLAVDPSNCIVLEDAESGVEAGKAAGMKVIAVPNEFTADQHFEKADKVLKSLEEVTWDLLISL